MLARRHGVHGPSVADLTGKVHDAAGTHSPADDPGPAGPPGPRGNIASERRIAGAVIDVLEVEEDDDPLGPRAGQRRGPKDPKRSPAGSGRSERRGGLPPVYSTGAPAQARRDRTTLTMCTGTVGRWRHVREQEEWIAGMRRVWNPLRGSSRVTMASHGGRCAGREAVLPDAASKRRPRTKKPPGSQPRGTHGIYPWGRMGPVCAGAEAGSSAHAQCEPRGRRWKAAAASLNPLLRYDFGTLKCLQAAGRWQVKNR